MHRAAARYRNEIGKESVDRGIAPLKQPVDVESENSSRIQTEYLGALVVGQMLHLTLNRLRRVWPRSFMMRVIVGP